MLSSSFLSAAFGKFDEGREMAKAVQLLLDKPGMQHKKSFAIFVLETFVYHWTSPLQGTLAPLLVGYQSGLETGDVERAGLNLVARSSTLWYSGRNLEGLQVELQTYINVLAQLNLESSRMEVLAYLLAVKKLRGTYNAEEDDDFEAILQVAADTGNKSLRVFTMTLQLELLVFDNEWKSATSLLLEVTPEDLASAVGMFIVVRFTFMDALVSLKKAQLTTIWLEKRKWKRRGVKSLKTLQGWAKKGNVNVVHSCYLVTAELAVLKHNKTEAEKNFKSATTIAAKNGFLQDKALAHQLAGQYFTSQGDQYWANYHKECSQKAFLEWGAMIKVEEDEAQ